MKTKTIIYNSNDNRMFVNLIFFCSKNKIINVTKKENDIYNIEYKECFKDGIINKIWNIYLDIVYYFINKGLYSEEKFLS